MFLKSEQPAQVKISLAQEGSRGFHIGIYVSKSDGSGYRVLTITPEDLIAKAAFSNAVEVSCVVELKDPSLPLVVIPCTFKPEQECEFRMTFESSAQISVTPIDPNMEYRMYTQVGKWEGETAGGCKNHPTVTNNPQYSLEVSKPTTITVTLSQTAKEPFDSIGIYVCKSKASGSKIGPSSELGPGLSPVVRPKSGGSLRGGKDSSALGNSGSGLTISSGSSSSGGGSSLSSSLGGGGSTIGGAKAARIKTLSSKNIVVKSEFSSDKEASVSFKAAPKYLYTIIPCCFEPNRESTFTLTCFSKRRVKLKAISHETLDIECSGQWHDESAGGCVNFPTWRNNPQYFLYAKRPKTEVQITLTQKRSFEPFAIGLYVARNTVNGQSRLLVLSADNLVGKTSFEKRHEVSTVVTLEDTETPYVIIPATFYQNQATKFTITVHVLGVQGAKEGVPIRAASVLNLLPCTFLWHQRAIKGEWKDGGENGGCRNHPTWLSNPQVALKVAQESKVVIILAVPDAKDSVGIYLLKDNRTINQSLRVKDGDAVEVVAKSVFRKEEEISLECTLEKGTYKGKRRNLCFLFSRC